MTNPPRPPANEPPAVGINLMDLALFAMAAFGVITALNNDMYAGRQGVACGGMISAAIALGFLALTRNQRCR